MRLAADRVLGALRTLDYAGAPLWRQAQRRLLARLTAPPAGGSTGGSASESIGGSGCENDEGAVDLESLAAAVAAATAAAPVVALEEEGLPYVEPKPKVGRPRVEACLLRR